MFTLCAVAFGSSFVVTALTQAQPCLAFISWVQVRLKWDRRPVILIRVLYFISLLAIIFLDVLSERTLLDKCSFFINDGLGS